MRVVTLVSLVVGLGLMLPFESPLSRVLGMGALVVFVVCGLFLVANPEDLGRER